MNRREFVAQADGLERLVRTEFDLTQEKMALVLGLSKKTLVEIEKGRTSLGWTGAVAFSAIFSGSQVLSGFLGGASSDMIQALAFAKVKPAFPRTMGGKVWWQTVEKRGDYRIQQNILSRN